MIPGHIESELKSTVLTGFLRGQAARRFEVTPDTDLLALAKDCTKEAYSLIGSEDPRDWDLAVALQKGFSYGFNGEALPLS